MIAERYAKGKKLIIVGLLVSIAAQTVASLMAGNIVGTIAGFAGLIGFVVYMIGCGEYAKAKGHQGYVGLLGLFFPIGFAILVWVVKDKTAQATTPTS
jgi:hypothetical protein